jgi:iron(III) transport system ATP-binding protein
MCVIGLLRPWQLVPVDLPSTWSGIRMSIEVRGLRKSFGCSVAVAGIDITVPQGEMLVLLGPSGCGKTTTMRCVAGLESPDSGRISIGGTTVFDDRDGTDVPVHKRHVGMVFQSYAIWPHMTVYQNVAFPLEMKAVGGNELKQRVHEALELVGLEGLSERNSGALSGGQMQRVALARSLVMRPSVLLFDEPLSNLDARLRDRLRMQLRELQTRLKITAIYVTHDQQEALAVADQIAVMEHGAVRQTDDPVSLYGRPKTGRIAEFLGYTNIFDVELVERLEAACEVAPKSGGRRLTSTNTPLPGTSDIVACVRPQDVAIEEMRTESGAAPSLGENTLTGEVTLASFMGSHMQYRVRTGADELWEVLSNRISTGIKVGSRVVLAIEPSDVHLLPRQ